MGSNGRKGRKRQLSEEHTAYLEQQHRKAAGTIAERHPNVTAVTLDLTFADPHFHVSYPTAARWVGWARNELHLLPPTSQGKARYA